MGLMVTWGRKIPISNGWAGYSLGGKRSFLPRTCLRFPLLTHPVSVARSVTPTPSCNSNVTIRKPSYLPLTFDGIYSASW